MEDLYVILFNDKIITGGYELAKAFAECESAKVYLSKLTEEGIIFVEKINKEK